MVSGVREALGAADEDEEQDKAPAAIQSFRDIQNLELNDSSGSIV